MVNGISKYTIVPWICRGEPGKKKRVPYFPLKYWLLNRDPYNSLLLL